MVTTWGEGGSVGGDIVVLFLLTPGRLTPTLHKLSTRQCDQLTESAWGLPSLSTRAPRPRHRRAQSFWSQHNLSAETFPSVS